MGCGRNRKIGKFARDSHKKDGKRIYCRECISILNKKYRTSPIGRIKHKKSVENWKKKNKIAIREYNKTYYIKKRHIILYNKKAREETESVLILDNFENEPKLHSNKDNRVQITINPKRKFESKTI